MINFSIENVQPVNQRLLVEKLPDGDGANDMIVAGPGGAEVKLTIFSKAGNYMRVRVVKVSTGTEEYPMIYKPGNIVVIPRMGIKADYTLDGKEYTFISMHDVIAIEGEIEHNPKYMPPIHKHEKFNDFSGTRTTGLPFIK